MFLENILSFSGYSNVLLCIDGSSVQFTGWMYRMGEGSPYTKPCAIIIKLDHLGTFWLLVQKILDATETSGCAPMVSATCFGAFVEQWCKRSPPQLCETASFCSHTSSISHLYLSWGLCTSATCRIRCRVQSLNYNWGPVRKSVVLPARVITCSGLCSSPCLTLGSFFDHNSTRSLSRLSLSHTVDLGTPSPAIVSSSSSLGNAEWKQQRLCCENLNWFWVRIV